MLTIHFYFGAVVVLTAVVAIFWPAARRIAQYVLIVQVLLGIGLFAMHYRVTPLHWILAILTGALWPLAVRFDRQGKPRLLAMGLCLLAVIVLAYVVHLGMASVKGVAL